MKRSVFLILLVALMASCSIYDDTQNKCREECAAKPMSPEKDIVFPHSLLWDYIAGIDEDTWCFYYNLSEPNNVVTLQYKNYRGNNQNIHPKVLYFPNGWNDHYFYMAYTPYPNGNTSAENPCIAVSEDGVNWYDPYGLSNPLVGTPSNGYNSDTHLVYDNENDILECWWREFSNKLGDRILRKRSADGVNWGETEVMLPFDTRAGMRLSPAVSIVDGRYVMVTSDCKQLVINRSLSDVPAFTPGEPEIVNREDDSLRIWHQDMIVNDEGIAEVVACCFTPDNNNNSADLYYFTLDLVEGKMSEPILILPRSKYEDAIDKISIYRASLVKVDNKYVVYYSCINKKDKRGISVLYGDSPLTLHPLPLPLY